MFMFSNTERFLVSWFRHIESHKTPVGKGVEGHLGSHLHLGRAITLSFNLKVDQKWQVTSEQK